MSVCFESAPPIVEDFDPGDDGPQLIYFRILASSGVPVPEEGYDHPVVLDLAGYEPSESPIPVLLAHGPTALVGWSVAAEVQAEGLALFGALQPNRWETSAVLGAVAGGLAWKASVGVRKDGWEVEHIAAGPPVVVNGRRYRPPLVVARKWELGEVSLTLNPSDAGTSVQFGGRFATDDEIEAGARALPNLGARGDMSGFRHTTKEGRPMPSFFCDGRGVSWALDLAVVSRGGVADLVMQQAAEEGGFAQLLLDHDALAATIQMLAYGPNGENPTADPGFLAWLGDRDGGAFEAVVPALAEAVVSAYNYHSTVVDFVSRAVEAATGRDLVGAHESEDFE